MAAAIKCSCDRQISKTEYVSGTLKLVKEGLQWLPSEASAASRLSLVASLLAADACRVASANKLPAGNEPAQYFLRVTPPGVDAVVLRFSSEPDRDAVKAHLLDLRAQQKAAKPTPAHDDEAKQALLRDRPDLAGAYRELVQEGAVTDAEFWQINAAALKTAVAQARRASENPSATGPDAEAASEQQQRARKQAQLLASFPWLRRACHHLVREQGVTVAEFWEKFAEFRRKQSAVLRRRRAGAEVADDIPDDQALAFFLKCQTEHKEEMERLGSKRIRQLDGAVNLAADRFDRLNEGFGVRERDPTLALLNQPGSAAVELNARAAAELRGASLTTTGQARAKGRANQMDDLVDQLDRMDREGGARAQAMSSGAVPGNKHRDGDGRKLDDLVRPPSPSPPEELPFHDTSQYLELASAADRGRDEPLLNAAVAEEPQATGQSTSGFTLGTIATRRSLKSARGPKWQNVRLLDPGEVDRDFAVERPRGALGRCAKRLLDPDTARAVVADAAKRIRLQRDMDAASAEDQAVVSRSRDVACAVHWVLGMLWKQMGRAGVLKATSDEVEVPAKARQEILKYLTLLDKEYERMVQLRMSLQGTVRDRVSGLLAPVERGIEEAETVAKRHGFEAQRN